MRCPNCGNDNKEEYRFCAKCGTKLEKSVPAYDFENEETVILDDNGPAADFENEETVTISDNGPAADFDNEETVILDDNGPAADFENEETVIQDEKRTAPEAPSFDYRTVYREYRTDYEDTAYIDHLRSLKGLLDDGIITEDEFTRKKQQILGLD